MPFHLVYDTDFKVKLILDQYITKCIEDYILEVSCTETMQNTAAIEENYTSKETEGKINSPTRNFLINFPINLLIHVKKQVRITRHLRKTNNTKWDQDENITT